MIPHKPPQERGPDIVNGEGQPEDLDYLPDDELADDEVETEPVSLGPEPVSLGPEPDFLKTEKLAEPDLPDGAHFPPGARIQPPPPPLHAAPSPEESTVDDATQRPRGLRMQWRFFHTILFAGWLFLRLFVVQIYVAKVARGWVERTNMKRFQRYAREFSNFAVEMGGIYIKMGQFVSTRVDILPEPIIKELEGLQDTVPAIGFKQFRYVLERELGDLNQIFEYINQEPIAAASLGQVHKARLANGEKVVVKVQRPGIREVCYTDLAAMRVVANFAMRFRFISRRSDAVALVEEFGRVFLEELSYKHEAYNATRFADMFKDDLGVYIPQVYFDYSTDMVLTMEDVTSIKLTDFAALEAAGINRKTVAKRLMDTYLPQVFQHYFFHADPHPGNLFVYPLPVEDESVDFGEEGRPFYLIFIDFGMTGTLTRQVADAMVSTLQAVLTRDAYGLVDSYFELGFLLPGADKTRIVEAMQNAFNQVWGMTITDMRDIDFDSVTDLAEEVGELMLTMPFYIPQDFLYLGRTVSILSGMCTSLDPQYNPWQELQPYTELLVKRGFGLSAQQQDGGLSLAMPVIEGILTGNPEVVQKFGAELISRTFGPITRTETLLRKVERGELHVVADLSVAHRQQLRRIEKESRKTGRSVFMGSLLIVSTLLYINGDVNVAIAALALAGITWFSGLFKD